MPQNKKPISDDGGPYIDSTAKPIGGFGKANPWKADMAHLVHPTSRTARVSAPAPHEETESAPNVGSPQPPHGSIEDVTFHEEAGADCKYAIENGKNHPVHKGYKGNGGLMSKGAINWGKDRDWGEDGDEPKGAEMSANRDNGWGIHYGAPVDHYGPDTDYRAEEIDPHQYGKDYEPFPLRDYHKTEDDQWERNFRLEEQDKYDETRTPGTVVEKNPMTEAYGARSYRDVEKARDIPDRRAFDAQREYARTNKKKSEEYAVDITGLDTKKGTKN